MSYYIDGDKIGLDSLKKRLEETDIVPSRTSLLDQINEQFAKLNEHGYLTLADLRKALKNPKHIPALSKRTGV